MTRGLLSRLGGDVGANGSDEVTAVIEHLRVLLNTTQGDSVTVPDYGVEDFTDLLHDVPDSIGALQQTLRGTILRFEPRLQNVVVRYLPGGDPLKLHFEVVARLVSDRSKLVRLQTAIDPGGHILID